MSQGTIAPMRRLPSVDRVLRALPDEVEALGHARVLTAVRKYLGQRRQACTSEDQEIESLEVVAQRITAILQAEERPTLLPVLNLTGTVIHTNLGRAPLPEEALQAALEAGRNACTLEYDLNTAKRGDRDVHVERLVCELTGAEAATVVNNNAAAVLLVLSTLAELRQVPVSRGELVEIGGSFRIPDVMARSGCTLVEVGTTNRTHLRDYEYALTERTAALMQVHTSNYRIEGFTHAVATSELSKLAKEHEIPLIVDLGSGSLVDFAAIGLPPEPTAQQALQAGADLITFSGDKLLGGPQAGIIAGRADLIRRVKRNPLKRALRVDKMTIAALSEVLKLYRNPDTLTSRLPTLQLLTRPIDEIKALAETLLPQVEALFHPLFQVSITECLSQIGSGALPVAAIPSFSLVITPHPSSDEAARNLGAMLRKLPYQ